MTTYEISRSALRPLMNAFWASGGWRSPPILPTGADLETAVATGVMFANPRSLAHDDWVAAAQLAAYEVDPALVGDAFVASLASRRLDLRSALGSFAVARRLPTHDFTAMTSSAMCAVCGLPGQSTQDLNVLSFERFKFGGVRRDDLRYVAFDLERFVRAPLDPVTTEALDLGANLLSKLREAPSAQTADVVASSLALLKGNHAERTGVVDILGVCGILATSDHPGYDRRFVQYRDRRAPPHRFVDLSYPTSWWRGSAGLDERAVRDFLPRLA